MKYNLNSSFAHLFIYQSSVKSLFNEDITAQTDKDIGMVTTAIGFSLSFFLALYKYEIGHKLQSLTITAGDQIVHSQMHS
jgi:divalent metal cation (Fe/Co/Zn/Cd) transporter